MTGGKGGGCMRSIIVGLLLLVPGAAWGEEISKDQARKEAAEDICFARSEYAEAENIFWQETGGSYSTNSPQAKYAREKDRKRQRLNQLQARYFKRFGTAFSGTCRP